MIRSLFVTALLLICLSSNNLFAELLWPVGDSGNGHYYEYVREQDITWEQAKIAAENSYNTLGWQGHLATITTQQELNFLASANFLGPGIINQYGDLIWIGGYQTPPNPEVDPYADWNWVTGEAWSFTNWSTADPDIADNYLAMDSSSFNLGTWHDFQNNQTTVGSVSEGYIVEYEPVAVPEPTAMALFALGIAWTFRSIKRNK